MEGINAAEKQRRGQTLKIRDQQEIERAPTWHRSESVNGRTKEFLKEKTHAQEVEEEADVEEERNQQIPKKKRKQPRSEVLAQMNFQNNTSFPGGNSFTEELELVISKEHNGEAGKQERTPSNKGKQKEKFQLEDGWSISIEEKGANFDIKIQENPTGEIDSVELITTEFVRAKLSSKKRKEAPPVGDDALAPKIKIEKSENHDGSEYKAEDQEEVQAEKNDNDDKSNLVDKPAEEEEEGLGVVVPNQPPQRP